MWNLNTDTIPENWNPDCENALNDWFNKIATERAEHYKVLYQVVE